MKKVREIVRLYDQQKLSMRQISISVNVSVSTVHRLLGQVKQVRLSWPQATEMSDEQLVKCLNGTRQSGASDPQKVLPDWQVIDQELAKKGVSRQLLWEEYVCLHGDENSYRYSRFCALYQQWRKRHQYSMVQHHRAGEKCFVDYSGQKVTVMRTDGKPREAQIFVATLGFSSYTYAEASWTQNSTDWLASNTRMLEFFGGVPRIIVPDNLKSAVSKACYYDPDNNSGYQQWAEHYQTTVLPARPKKPRDKAVVEAGVAQVQRRILAPLRKQTFYSLSQLNEAIAKQLKDLNARPFQKRPGSRLQQFLEVDQPALRPLPKHRFDMVESRTVKVHMDYHVQFEQHQYSVPYQYVGQKLQLHASTRLVKLYYGNCEIASHLRISGYGYSTEAEHMPKNHRQQAKWTPKRMLKRAQKIGSNAECWVQLLFDSKDHPEQGYRVVLGLFSLARKYPTSRIEKACQIACRNRMLRLKQIKNILANKFDQTRSEQTPSKPLPQQHVNVRGPNYFQ